MMRDPSRLLLGGLVLAVAVLTASGILHAGEAPTPPNQAAASAGQPKPSGDGAAPAPAEQPKKPEEGAAPPKDGKPAAEGKPAPDPAVKPTPGPEAKPAPAEPSETNEENKARIGSYVEFRFSDDEIGLHVDKVRSIATLSGPEAADEMHFRARHTTASMALRVEAEPFFSGILRAGGVRASLSDTIRPGHGFLLLSPTEREQQETAALDLGGLLGLGGELRFPVFGPVRAGLLYDLEYGMAKAENVRFLMTTADCEYRYFSHEFLLFADLPIRLEKPFQGWLRPRLGFGGFLVRAGANIDAVDKSMNTDWNWSADMGVLVTFDLAIEADGGVYAFLRAEFLGRTSLCAGAGVRI
jgi:hypothetical protein